MHHDPDDQRRTDQHDTEDREAGDGRHLPHVGRLLHRFTCVAGRGLRVLLAGRAGNAHTQIRVPELRAAALIVLRVETGHGR